ncbi:MAG: low molecular weight phosphatase family protein [Syntrophobacter sp.]
MGRDTMSVLFLCYGNSCRSILAEALARHCWPPSIRVSSAGLFPLGHITPHTLAALGEAGIPANGLYSKGFPDIQMEEIDYIVDLTGLDIRDLIPPAFPGKLLSFNIHDPYGEGLDSFRKVRDELKRLITEKLPKLLEPENGAHRHDGPPSQSSESE